MQECERNLNKNRVIMFSKIAKILLTEGTIKVIPDIDTIPICKSSPTRHSISGCFLHRFWENEKAYTTQMIAGSVPSEESWLSCDHTFKSVANIGVFRSADGKWVEQYSGLFCVLNYARELGNLQKTSVEEQMHNLQQRLLYTTRKECECVLY